MMGSSNSSADAQHVDEPPLTGRICMVTGATGGLGEVVATELARRGATVILVCRRATGQATCSRWRLRSAAGELVLRAC